MTDIQMPKLSESMEDGTVLTWLRKDGEMVRAGDELLEIETDKATVTVSAEVDGIVQILVGEGTTVRVGDVIATVSDGTDSAPAGNGSQPEHSMIPEPTATGASAPSGEGPAPTPLARRTARVHGVDLTQLRGTGPRGRITRTDVLGAAGVTRQPPRVQTLEPPRQPVAASVPPTRIQQRIAARMTESRTTIPEFEVATEVTMDAARSARDELRALVTDRSAPSINDLIIKACALALRRHPDVNAHYVAGAVQRQSAVNIGIAVARPDALIVPVVHDADTASLGAIAQTTRRLAERVRDGTIAPDELEGATFTVSNLGMYGMTAIRPVIDPPQVAILGVGAVRETMARIDGEIVDRSVMTLTLSADHRALYGAAAAEFLADVRSLLEAPVRMLI